MMGWCVRMASISAYVAGFHLKTHLKLISFRSLCTPQATKGTMVDCSNEVGTPKGGGAICQSARAHKKRGKTSENERNWTKLGEKTRDHRPFRFDTSRSTVNVR